MVTENKKKKITWQSVAKSGLITLLNILGWAIALNIGLFALDLGSEQFATSEDTFEHLIAILVNLTDLHQMPALVVGIIFVAFVRGFPKSIEKRIVKDAVGEWKKSNRVTLQHRLQLKLIDRFTKIFSRFSTLVLIPVIDPRTEASIQSIIQTLEPYAFSLARGGWLTIIFVTVLISVVGMTYRIITEPDKLPAKIEAAVWKQSKNKLMIAETNAAL